MATPRNGFLRFLTGTLRGIDITRRVVIDVIFIAIIVIVLIVIFAPNAPPVPATAALKLDPQGMLVEQIPNPVQRAMRKLIGQSVQPVTRVRDLEAALSTAADDAHIKLVALDLNDFSGGSLAQLERVGKALKAFEKSGKPVIAYAANYTQGSYYLASMANDAYLTTNQGMVTMMGLSAYRNYYKDLIDKLKIQWHVFRVGKYKSYVEPYTRNNMSPAAKQENTDLLDELWDRYVNEVAAGRNNKAADLTTLVNHLPAALEDAKGDAAALATRSNLIDGVMSLPALRAKIASVVGTDQSTGSYNRIGMRAYLKARQPEAQRANRSWDQVAVIVAQGDIGSGTAPPGAIGSATLSALLGRAQHDDRVKAVVLDVDSPGGSALASDHILQAELALKASGKPLIVSMAGVAASGGYWISMAADKIFASPSTITGSIGIFGMLPTFEKTLAWAGVHRDGVETSPLADFGDPLRPLGKDEATVFQQIVGHGYAEFTGHVAHYRNLPLSHVQAIAQGRVWAGRDAKRIGLIDQFGDLDTAIKAAAKMAKLQQYGVTYIAQRLSASQKFIIQLASDPKVRSIGAHLFTGDAGYTDSALASFSPLLNSLKHTLAMQDKSGLYAYCFCDALAELH
ncbi:MAG: signal peptide peptidase SppA [Gammaproteobacteria bacterium]